MEESNAKIRAFVAIDIPEELKDSLLSINLDRKMFRMVSRDNLHITLFFLGNITSRQIEIVEGIIGRLLLSPFRISIVGIDVFTRSRPRVIYAKIAEGAQALSGLYNAMKGEIGACCKIEEREFVPHLTIARAKGIKRGGFEVIEKYSEKEFGAFECREIKLKRSVLSSSGPTYSDLFVKELS